MSDLTDAMHDAVASVATRGQTERARGAADSSGVRVLDLDALPPVRGHRYQARSVADLVEEQVGAAARRAWQLVGEAIRMVLLFWGAAIGVAFVDSMGDGNFAGPTMLWASLAVTAVLRGLLALRSPGRSG